ncbi:MAG: tyrosine-type recombinase/integrase [Oscillospiraceae bacterium]
MRNPNGYGGVTRLPGNRRRPYRARVTVGWEERDAAPKLQQYATIGYFSTRAEALLALAEFNMTAYDARLRRMTFRQVYDSWSPGYFERYPSTRRVTESAMQHCAQLWNRPMAELRLPELQRTINSMEGLSRAYQAKVRSLMHQLYQWCFKHDILQKDYSQFVELPSEAAESRRSVFTAEEISLLWRYHDSGVPLPGQPQCCSRLCFLEALLVLLYTGMRISELLALRCEDIHLDERYIDLHGTKTKAARRLVPICARILPVISALSERASGGLLLRRQDGQAVTYSVFKYTWFDSVMGALGMRHTPHDTRHTFVSGLDTAGVQRSVQKFIVGHSLSKDVTDRYTHKDISELVRAVDMLEY